MEGTGAWEGVEEVAEIERSIFEYISRSCSFLLSLGLLLALLCGVQCLKSLVLDRLGSCGKYCAYVIKDYLSILGCLITQYQLKQIGKLSEAHLIKSGSQSYVADQSDRATTSLTQQ